MKITSYIPIITALTFFSCVQDDQYDLPDIVCNDATLPITTTIADVLAMSNTQVTQYPTKGVLEAYVT